MLSHKARRCTAFSTFFQLFRALPLIAAALLTLCLAGCASPRAPVADVRGLFPHAAVACDHPVASRAGLEMLELGGNAVDAAVAASFCLSVVRPDSCGIGGGGFMLIWIPPTHPRGPARIAINYRETCPAAIGPEFFEQIDDPLASRYGCSAVAVPGTVAGLLLALDHYGSLDRWTVLEPAIRAAEDGWPADAHHVAAIEELRQVLVEHDPHYDAQAWYFWEQLGWQGQVKVGDRLTNPQQARALRLIAEQGTAAFTHGEIAQAIITAMKAGGGVLTQRDLESYEVAVTTPLRGSFGGDEVLTMPPPSSGGIAQLQVLTMMDEEMGWAFASRSSVVHDLVECFKHAFADRAAHLADPAFVDVPIDQLLNPEALRHAYRSIQRDRTRPPQEYGTSLEAAEDAGTSHLSAVDSQGIAVACTETINLPWGSLVCVPGFGFALNNQMDDFTTRRGQANAFGLSQSERNMPQPGKRPLSSMSPTIVLRDGNVVLVAGASGGPRIITSTLQVIMCVLREGMHPVDAVASPRFHHQWMPDVLEFEPTWTDRSMIREMKKRGHVVGQREQIGCVQIIRVDEHGVVAACDPRKGGEPAGN